MNIIDLRDIVENKETESDTYEAWKEALWDDAGYAIEDVAENEPTMIPASDFAAYAQELAEWICSDESGHIWEEIVPHPSRLEIAVNSNLVA